jgi:meso-butanediol dehydrogenase/(S,S)-butanediol dehydrogenase/diacetyl reductase
MGGTMKIDFSGKRVLVTGGTRGIGRATVKAFLDCGARVAVNGSSEASAGKAIAGLKNAVAVAGDLSRVDECKRVIEAAVAALGGLDVLINNAGVGGSDKPFEETTEADWEAVMRINLRAPYFCTRHAAPHLRKAKGNVVNIASVLGVAGRGGDGRLALYATSKGGVVNMTRDLAITLAPVIRVNCVCPGAVDTEMLQELGRQLGQGDVAKGYAIITQNRPMKRVADASEIANVILYLASDMASFVTGSIHMADGGVTAKAG